MKITRVFATTAIVAAVLAQSATAQSLRNAAEPAEFPPASYKGTQYVDSKGCVYIRAGISGNITWVPRVSRDRKQVCGQAPSLNTRTAQAQPAQRKVAEQPVQIAIEQPAQQAAAPAPKPKPAAKPAVRRVATAAPAPKKAAPKKAPARVTRQIAKPVRKAPVAVPRRQTAVVVPQSAARVATAPAPQPVVRQRASSVPVRRATACGVTSVSQRYVHQSGSVAVRCGPQTAPVTGNHFETATSTATVAPQPRQAQPRQAQQRVRGTTIRVNGAQITANTRVVPRHVKVNRKNTRNLPVPQGYRRVWDDDRLNPKRAEQTIGGVLRTNYLWTNTVPRRLINPSTREDVTAKVPLVYPYVDMATQQRELGQVSIVQRDGQTLKRIVRNKAVVRQPVVSSRSAPVTKPKATKHARPKATAAGGRYVQVGTFGQPANAQATAQRLKSMGLPVRVGTFQRGGKSYRLVLAGPFGNNANQALTQVRRAGYGDAFLRK